MLRRSSTRIAAGRPLQCHVLASPIDLHCGNLLIVSTISSEGKLLSDIDHTWEESERNSHAVLLRYGMVLCSLSVAIEALVNSALFHNLPAAALADLRRTLLSTKSARDRWQYRESLIIKDGTGKSVFVHVPEWRYVYGLMGGSLSNSSRRAVSQMATTAGCLSFLSAEMA